jgi:hypothetical protein
MLESRLGQIVSAAPVEWRVEERCAQDYCQARSRKEAEAKDKLERRLCEMVCAGQLDIATAQEEIATDWIAAYRKYYGEGSSNKCDSQGTMVFRDSRGNATGSASTYDNQTKFYAPDGRLVGSATYSNDGRHR